MNNKYKETKKLTSEDFNKWAKEIFANNRHPQKRWIIIGYDTIVGFRKEMGDDKLYGFVKAMNIMCGEDTATFIENFIEEYELKNRIYKE
jgi:hypothetical protein